MFIELERKKFQFVEEYGGVFSSWTHEQLCGNKEITYKFSNESKIVLWNDRSDFYVDLIKPNGTRIFLDKLCEKVPPIPGGGETDRLAKTLKIYWVSKVKSWLEIK